MLEVLGAVKMESVLWAALDVYYPENFQDLVDSLNSGELSRKYEEFLGEFDPLTDVSIQVMERLSFGGVFSSVSFLRYFDDSFALHLNFSSRFCCSGRSRLSFSAFFALDDLEVKQ